jgi:hypothetical protein
MNGVQGEDRRGQRTKSIWRSRPRGWERTTMRRRCQRQGRFVDEADGLHGCACIQSSRVREWEEHARRRQQPLLSVCSNVKATNGGAPSPKDEKPCHTRCNDNEASSRGSVELVSDRATVATVGCRRRPRHHSHLLSSLHTCHILGTCIGPWGCVQASYFSWLHHSTRLLYSRVHGRGAIIEAAANRADGCHDGRVADKRGGIMSRRWMEQQGVKVSSREVGGLAPNVPKTLVNRGRPSGVTRRFVLVGLILDVDKSSRAGLYSERAVEHCVCGVEKGR